MHFVSPLSYLGFKGKSIIRSSNLASATQLSSFSPQIPAHQLVLSHRFDLTANIVQRTSFLQGKKIKSFLVSGFERSTGLRPAFPLESWNRLRLQKFCPPVNPIPLGKSISVSTSYNFSATSINTD